MRDYIIGFIFVIALSLLFYSIGAVSTNKNKSDGYKLMIGYLIYSFFIGAFGMIVQLFNVPWKIYLYIVILTLIGTTLYVVYQIKFREKKIFDNGIKEYFKNNYFLFVVTILLMIVFLFSYNALWFNNHLDDGYYLTKIADLPYVSNPYTFNYSTGFPGQFTFERIINTHELELSTYVYFLNISPSLFTRFFMTGLHYFVFVNSVSAFAYAVLKKINSEFNYYFVQFIPLILILFSFNENFIRFYGLGYYFDSNQFINAAYYGSTMVRTMSFIFLITPFLSQDKIDIKMILCVMGISVVLLSKSTIALPLIFLIAFFYVLTTLFFISKKYFIPVIGFILFLVATIFISKTLHVMPTEDYLLNNILKVNMKSIQLIISYIIILLSYLLRNKYVNRISTILIMLLVFTQVPILSGLYSALSIYTFVAGRGLTLINYTCLIYSFTVLCYFISKLKFQKTIFYVLCGCLFITSAFSYHLAGGSLFYDENKLSPSSLLHALNAIRHNSQFFPETTIELGNTLEEYVENNNKELNVIMTRLVACDGADHSLPIIVRTFCPSEKIHIISSIYRYGNPMSTQFKDFTEQDQEVFENYTVNPSRDSFSKLEVMVNKYDINCLIMPNDKYNDDVMSLGYTLVKTISNSYAGITHYIYVR